MPLGVGLGRRGEPRSGSQDTRRADRFHEGLETAVNGAAPDVPGRWRDRRPGMVQVDEAEDGAVARVRLPGGRLLPSQMAALADAAACGSGVVDLTACANVQLHGVRSPGELAVRLGAAGLLTHGPVGNIVASPLAGRHPTASIDADDLVAALDRGLCADRALARLPGRFLFAVEDGSGAVAGLDHDVLLTPDGDDIALVLAGFDTGLRAAATGGPGLALAAARAFLAVAGDATRMHQIPSLTRDREPWIPPRTTVIAPGITRQRDGRVAVTALAPLGRVEVAQLRGLAALGADVRVSPWRTITLVDRPDATVADDLDRLGFVLATSS